MTVPQLLSGGDLATFGGAVTAVVAVTNTLRQTLNLNPRIVGLVTSFAVCLVAAYFNPDVGGFKWVLAPLNACLIYCGAAGLSSVGSNITSGRSRRVAGSPVVGRAGNHESKDKSRDSVTEETVVAKTSFFDPWF